MRKIKRSISITKQRKQMISKRRSLSNHRKRTLQYLAKKEESRSNKSFCFSLKHKSLVLSRRSSKNRKSPYA